MKPYAKLYVSSPAVRGIFGNGKWQLLTAVNAHGSISKAAAALKRSYRKAWGDILVAEQAIGQPLVRKSRGGACGGRTEITDYCRALLCAWEKHHSAMAKAQDASYNRHLKELLENPASYRAPKAAHAKGGR